MAPTKLIQLSDPHLSRSHPFFMANWRSAAAAAGALGAALTIVSGDLTVNGADSADDLAAAAAALALIAGPRRALPGNHDVGDEPPGQDDEQLINDQRRARYLAACGADWWLVELGGWRLIGLDSQLCGSGLAAEEEQYRWLGAMLAPGDARPVGVFLHKPPFLDHPDETEIGPTSLLPQPRARLLALLRPAPVKFVASGHLHQYRVVDHGGVRFISAPSTAFLVSRALPGAQAELGFLGFALEPGGGFSHQLHAPPGFDRHDLDRLKGHGRFRFLRDMPPDAVAAAMRDGAAPT